MGAQVFAPGIRILDDPLRPRGLRSKPFDAEGLATRPCEIVSDGKLRTWLLDQRSARQLGLKSTGHAARGSGGPPSPASTNTYLEPGKDTPEALMAGIERGLFVTNMMGSSVSLVTGDYSRGAAGYWIENGTLAYPVSEITIAGHLAEMFRNLTPANDLVFRYGIDVPTLRIDGMTVAGA
jgi:PmbA protein